jgi:hypothetical protein
MLADFGMTELLNRNVHHASCILMTEQAAHSHGADLALLLALSIARPPY